jgi:hypothetical protein
MKHNPTFVQLQKVYDIIESCITKKQLLSCKTLIKNYVKMLKHQGVINCNDVVFYLLLRYDEVAKRIEYSKQIDNISINIQQPVEYKHKKKTRLVAA